MATKGSVETVVHEIGHGYVDLLDDPGVVIPPPNEELVGVIQDLCQDYGIDYKLIHIADDTDESLSKDQIDSKEDIVDSYLEKWSYTPDEICWESEAADVWENDWTDYQSIDGVTGSSKNVPFSCVALDAAMTAEKLGETDQTSIPSMDFAVTQHDENLPVPSIGGYSSFHNYEGQQASHEIQEVLHDLGVLETPTWKQESNFEYNPEKKSEEEFLEELEEVIA